MAEIIKDVVFADDACTRVRFTIEDNETGKSSRAELVVPEKYAEGVNKYWDLILKDHNVEDLRSQRQAGIAAREEQRKILEQKRESDRENRELKRLFDLKSGIFKMPFVDSDEAKSLVRKAPNELCLNYVVFKLMSDYLEKNGNNLDVMFDDIEDSLYDE